MTDNQDAATDENGSPPPEGAGDPAPPSTEDPLSHSSLPAETIMHYFFNNGEFWQFTVIRIH